MELNCFCSPELERNTPITGQMAFLETFWDSGQPRCSLSTESMSQIFTLKIDWLSCSFLAKDYISEDCPSTSIYFYHRSTSFQNCINCSERIYSLRLTKTARDYAH